MTAPLVVVYASNRPFRAACDALLRGAGARVRLASRQAELAKALGDGAPAVIITGEHATDRAVATALASTTTSATPVVQRAPGESMEDLVRRALLPVAL